jgi:hypothetical protein
MAVGRGERRGVKETGHRWEFKARFRRTAFGRRSQPAVQRVKEAVSEIKRVARRNPVLAGDGAVTLLERISPVLESVDSSSGSIGTAVHNAIEELVPIIGAAPADPRPARPGSNGSGLPARLTESPTSKAWPDIGASCADPKR